jgi:hypothetical protein
MIWLALAWRAWLSYRRAAQIPGSVFNGSGRDSVMVRQVRGECRHWILVSQEIDKHLTQFIGSHDARDVSQPRCAVFAL